LSLVYDTILALNTTVLQSLRYKTLLRALNQSPIANKTTPPCQRTSKPTSPLVSYR
jgi:hypothetical protein